MAVIPLVLEELFVTSPQKIFPVTGQPIVLEVYRWCCSKRLSCNFLRSVVKQVPAPWAQRQASLKHLSVSELAGESAEAGLKVTGFMSACLPSEIAVAFMTEISYTFSLLAALIVPIVLENLCSLGLIRWVFFSPPLQIASVFIGCVVFLNAEAEVLSLSLFKSAGKSVSKL